MSDDLALKMYEAQAELIEIKEKLEKIQKENDELRNERAANHLIKTVEDFQQNNSNRFEAIEENLRKLTTIVYNNHDTFVEIKETLKNLKETIQVSCFLVDDHAKLSEIVGPIQVNATTLSTKVSSSDQILSEINETLRKQNVTLEKQNKNNQVLKKNIKILDNETILLLGGWVGKNKTDSLLVLQNNEKNDGNWTELNVKLPDAVCYHGAQFLNNYLYIFGGKNEKNEVLNSTYKLTRGHKWLTKNGLKWEKVTDMNKQRMEISNSSVILNDRIWVIGGWNEGDETLKSVEMYDPQMNIWTNVKSMNECRTLAAAAEVNGKIFCCGGSNGYNFLKSIECYDPSSDIWTLISDMPGPNAACGVMAMDGHLIVIGGKTSKDKGFLNSVWVLDTTDKNAKWVEKKPRMSRPLCQLSIAKIDDKIFVCGGLYISKEDSKLRCTHNVEIFDGEVWSNGPKLTTSLQGSAAVVIPVEFLQYLH